MKRPKITIEEMIEREGRWLGGVRPAEYGPSPMLLALHDLKERNFATMARQLAPSIKQITRILNQKNPVLEGIPVLRRDDPRVHLPPERP